MSRLHIKFPMHLTVKLSEHKFYHHKSSCKQENMLKTVPATLFDTLVSWILFSINYSRKGSFKMTYWDSCPFQQIFNIQSPLKVTSFSFNIVLFLRNTSSSIFPLHQTLIKCFCKTTTLLNGYITQQGPKTSV